MKAWVLVDFQIDEARYYKGSLEELPDEMITSLARYGIVSTTKPAGVIT